MKEKPISKMRDTHMMPYASPLRRANRSSRLSVAGANNSPAPTPPPTPCSAISCQTSRVKAEARKLALVMRRPMGPHQRRREGQSVRRAKVKGEER